MTWLQRITRPFFKLTALLFVASLLCAQTPSLAPDIKVDLRSATGSNRFQLGELIPLELLVSSPTPHRYLEPCKLFWEGCFGFPQCRFETVWSFSVTPATGWTDIGFHGCSTMSGPTTDSAITPLIPPENRPSQTTFTPSDRPPQPHGIKWPILYRIVAVPQMTKRSAGSAPHSSNL